MTDYSAPNYRDENCVFCKIIEGTIPSQKVLEDDMVIAFKDNAPKAPAHIIVTPKPHVKDIMELDAFLMGKILEAIQTIARANGFDKKGFNVVNNCGEAAGQSVFHAHFHILSGKKTFDL